MHKYGFKFVILFLIGIFLLPTISHSQKEEILRLNGSTTVNNFIFFEKEKQLYDELAIPFKIDATSSGRGLIALHENKADVAMISSELEALIKKLRENNPSLKVDDFELYKISETTVLFGVHKSNPIDSLTKEQVKGLFVGDIKNWSELGVNELGPVLIVTEHPTGGVYNTVVSKLLNNEPITKRRITMQNGPQVGLVVAQNPGGFGMISDATPRDQLINTKIISTPDAQVSQSLYLVTRKSEDRQHVLKFVKFIQDRYK